MEYGATVSQALQFAELSLAGVSSLASIAPSMGILPTSQIKDLLETRAK